MSGLDIQNPNRILFGIDVFGRIGELVKELGERALIISEAAIQDNPYVGQLKSNLQRAGVNALVYDELQSSSGSETMGNLLAMAKASRPNCVIGIGGMKALSIARTVSVLATENLSFEKYLNGESPRNAALAFVSVPTTCRDHFFAQNRFVMTDPLRQRPVIVESSAKSPRIILLDPKISASLSPKYYSVVMIDVLLAAVEAFTSTKANFLSDNYALSAIEKIGQAYLDFAHNPRDIRPRTIIAEAGLLTSLALGVSSQGLGGAISYAVNSRFGIPKSWASTAMLPLILDLHGSQQAQKVALIAKALGEDIENSTAEDAAPKASKAARRIVAKLELPSRLRDFNLAIDVIPEIADIVLELEYSRSLPFNVSHQLLCDLIKQAF